jgi:hypothetical protein
MRRYRPFAATSLLAVLVLLSIAGSVSASTICESALPFNIDAGSLEPVAIALLHRSPTFQQQCLRIARTVVLRVRVRITPRLQGGRGETTIQRYDTGALRAEIVLLFGQDYVELLAHEFEHVLEQVDQVSLPHEVTARRAWVTGTGAFETIRAWEIGVRTRQEVDALTAEAIEAGRRVAPRPRDPFE